MFEKQVHEAKDFYKTGKTYMHEKKKKIMLNTKSKIKHKKN